MEAAGATSPDVVLSPWHSTDPEQEVSQVHKPAPKKPSDVNRPHNRPGSRDGVPSVIHRLTTSHSEPHGPWANLLQLPPGDKNLATPAQTRSRALKRRQADDLLQRPEFRRGPNAVETSPAVTMIKLRSDHTPYSRVVALLPADRPLTSMAEEFEVQVPGGHGQTARWVKVQTTDGAISGWCEETDLPGGVASLATDDLVNFLTENHLHDYISRLKALGASSPCCQCRAAPSCTSLFGSIHAQPPWATRLAASRLCIIQYHIVFDVITDVLVLYQ